MTHSPTTDSFSHTHEAASPGRYSVTLGPSGIGVDLSVTTRTGISEVTFPATSSANLLFKVADSANPVSASSVHVVGDDRGHRPGDERAVLPDRDVVHALLRRDVQPSVLDRGNVGDKRLARIDGSAAATRCGAYVSFDTSRTRRY